MIEWLITLWTLEMQLNYNLLRYELSTGNNRDILVNLCRTHESEILYKFLLQLDDKQLKDIGVIKRHRTYYEEGVATMFYHFIFEEGCVYQTLIRKYKNSSDEIRYMHLMS